jgi:putative membrane protein
MAGGGLQPHWNFYRRRGLLHCPCGIGVVVVMKKLAFVSACLLLSAPLLATHSLAQSVAEKTGVNSTLGVAPKTADFVKEAAISDMFEIKEGQLAADRGNDATKQFANRMITDHTKTSSDLKGMVDAGKVKATLPTALDSSHQKKLDKLDGLHGSDFDKQYRSDQISAHKTAVSLFERYGKGGDNADLKAWAEQVLPTIQDHYKMAQNLGK